MKKEDPVEFRFRVWNLYGIYFVSRRVEFHHQFERDDRGSAFLSILHLTHQTNDATDEKQQ